MTRRLVLFAILAVVWAQPASAILPIAVKSNPKEGFGGRLQVGLSGKSGNNDEQDFELSGLIRHRTQDRIWLLLYDYNYGKTNDQRDEDDVTVHLRRVQQNLIAPRWDVEGFVQLEQDEFEDLESRRLLGGGVRWRSLTKESSNSARDVLFGMGMFYEWERSQSGAEDANGLRANLYGKFVYDRDENRRPYRLYTTVYVQPMVDDASDLRAIGIGGLALDFSQRLVLSVEASVDHDSEPFPGVEKTDTEFTVQLGYSLD